MSAELSLPPSLFPSIPRIPPSLCPANPGLMVEPYKETLAAAAGDTVTLTVYVSTSDGHLNLFKWDGPNGPLYERANI